MGVGAAQAETQEVNQRLQEAQMQAVESQQSLEQVPAQSESLAHGAHDHHDHHHDPGDHGPGCECPSHAHARAEASEALPHTHHDRENRTFTEKTQTDKQTETHDHHDHHDHHHDPGDHGPGCECPSHAHARAEASEALHMHAHEHTSVEVAKEATAETYTDAEKRQQELINFELSRAEIQAQQNKEIAELADSVDDVSNQTFNQTQETVAEKNNTVGEGTSAREEAVAQTPSIREMSSQQEISSTKDTEKNYQKTNNAVHETEEVKNRQTDSTIYEADGEVADSTLLFTDTENEKDVDLLGVQPHSTLDNLEMNAFEDLNQVKDGESLSVQDSSTEAHISIVSEDDTTFDTVQEISVEADAFDQQTTDTTFSSKAEGIPGPVDGTNSIVPETLEAVHEIDVSQPENIDEVFTDFSSIVAEFIGDNSMATDTTEAVSGSDNEELASYQEVDAISHKQTEQIVEIRDLFDELMSTLGDNRVSATEIQDSRTFSESSVVARFAHQIGFSVEQSSILNRAFWSLNPYEQQKLMRKLLLQMQAIAEVAGDSKTKAVMSNTFSASSTLTDRVKHLAAGVLKIALTQKTALSSQ